jgi:hypothetical protein
MLMVFRGCHSGHAEHLPFHYALAEPRVPDRFQLLRQNNLVFGQIFPELGDLPADYGAKADKDCKSERNGSQG